MMKKRLWWILVFFIVFIVVLTWLSPKVINWTDNFRENSKDPYGCHIIVNEFHDIFTEFDIQTKPLFTSLKEDSLRTGNYIFVTSSFDPSDDELDNLLEWVSRGNQAFVSASTMGGNLLDTLNLEDQYHFLSINSLMESDVEVYIEAEDSITVPKKYRYAKQNRLIYYSTKHDSLVEATSHSNFDIDEKQEAIMVSQDVGLGKIYLHSLPHAFTNYYLLKMDNHEYASGLLSFLPDEPTYWDEYYKPVPYKKEASMETFLANRGFRWAFYFGIALLGISIIFKFKRNQRIIPIVNPPENRTLEYIKTIGDLYWSTNDTKDLLHKMEKHYKEFIREKYFMHDYTGLPEQSKKLAGKSGKTKELITSIDTMLANYKNHALNGEDLIRLNKKLHLFYYGGK